MSVDAAAPAASTAPAAPVRKFIRYNPRSARFELEPFNVAPGSVLPTQWLLTALEQTREFARGELLDIGCGYKPYREFFGAERHVGVDWPGTTHHGEVDVYASADSIPLENESFDTVLCTEVIEHLRHPSRALEEIRRLLRPGGHLILSAPFVHQLHERPYDFYRYTPFALKAMVEDAGMECLLIADRGGYLTVFLTLGFKMWAVNVRTLLHRLRFRGSFLRAFTWALVIGPQQAWGALLTGARKSKSRLNPLRYLDARGTITLGYVMVASRPEGMAGDATSRRPDPLAAYLSRGAQD